ncbi:hypothetical protein LWI28_004439 [Acer negundo]|uniref:Uncharacterized protein n=1 Tax=Acer negundo TaxID=4023 RepID=A0AAD5IKK3_ACENE|nr:hypothetical protein LWI28_004439 [Acer negundo]
MVVHVDKENSNIASDSRNVRLGLAADGFNPFRTMSTAHNTWHVVLIPYNLPPWTCMKQPFFMLSMHIDSPKGLSNKIDVYLQPLIEGLKELWHEGVLTYNAPSNEMFKLHAALLWTINDFPASGNLSGWSTRGSSASSDVRKGQGPAQIISKWGRGHKLHLEFDSTWGPIGPNAQPLETQLGNIVKNGMMAPMTYLEWNYMSNELLDRIWTEVTGQFEEHLCNILAEEQTNIVREQVFTQVMGPDDHSRVLLYGAGTTSSNVVGQNSNVDEIWVELDELSSNYKNLQSKCYWINSWVDGLIVFTSCLLTFAIRGEYHALAPFWIVNLMLKNFVLQLVCIKFLTY